jgi:hypothetical protein
MYREVCLPIFTDIQIYFFSNEFIFIFLDIAMSCRISNVHKLVMLFLDTISSISTTGELSSTSAIRARLSGFLSSFFLLILLFVASIAPILSKFCFFLCEKTRNNRVFCVLPYDMRSICTSFISHLALHCAPFLDLAFFQTSS